jgi:hypothetical protein
MLNAIDINQFLSKDQQQSVPVPLEARHATLFDILGQSPALCTDACLNQSLGMFCFGINQTTIGFFDTHQQKKFLFQFDVASSRISMNERRAQLSEIHYFKHRLAVFAKWACFDAIGTVPGSGDIAMAALPSAIVLKLARIFELGNGRVGWSPFSLDNARKLKDYLNRIAKQCQKQVQQSQDQQSEQHLFDVVTNVVKGQRLAPGDCVLVTNAKRVISAKNVVYSMYIYYDSIQLISNNQTEKTTVSVNIKSKKAVFNHQALAPNAVSWVLGKFNTILADMSAGRVDILESISN